MNRLAPVLSMLARASKLSQREISRRCGFSASYLSRILSGERIPTWRRTESFAKVCGADPAVVRAVWESERLREFSGVRQPTSEATELPSEVALAALRSALGTLHVRAGSPTAYDIAVATRWRMTPDLISGMIACDDLTDWDDFALLLYVLGGEVTYFRPSGRPRPPAPARRRTRRPPTPPPRRPLSTFKPQQPRKTC